jgi:tetratricopeptide (TPR) repeat protein
VASLGNLALAYRDAGRLREALPLLERAVVGAERALGPAHPGLAVVLYQLGQVLSELGDLASAVTILSRAVEVDTAAYGPDHPEVATDLDALAAVLEEQGNLKEAAAIRSRTQRIREQPQPGPATGSATAT